MTRIGVVGAGAASAAAVWALDRRLEDDAIYCLGDWTVGTPRLHGALRSGLDTADRVLDAR